MRLSREVTVRARRKQEHQQHQSWQGEEEAVGSKRRHKATGFCNEKKKERMAIFDGNDKNQWPKFAAKFLIIGAMEGGWDKALEMQLDLEVAANKKLNKLAWCYLTLMLQGAALDEMDMISEKNAYAVWQHLNKKYEPRNENLLEQESETHTGSNQKREIKPAEDQCFENQEGKNSYCYFDLWNEENTNREENDEETEEFSVDPRHDYNTADDVDTGFEKDDEHIQVKLMKTGTDKDVEEEHEDAAVECREEETLDIKEDGEKCTVRDDKSFKNDEMSLVRERGKNEDVKNQEKSFIGEEESLKEEYHVSEEESLEEEVKNDKEYFIGEEEVKKEEEEDTLAIYFSDEKGDYIKKGKCKISRKRKRYQ